jgi:hypothetical protein
MAGVNIFRTPKTAKFVQFDRALCDNRALSLEAKAVMMYCLSKPDRWHFVEADIIKSCLNGRDSVRRAISDLVRYGYILKVQERDSTGTYNVSIWYILEEPNLINQIPGYRNAIPYREPCSGGVAPAAPLPDIPPTGNPETDKPSAETRETENRTTETATHSNTINTKTETERTNHPYSVKFPAWWLTFGSYLVQYGVMTPDDVSSFDWIDAKQRVDYFLSPPEPIKNPKKYLETLLQSIRRKTPEEIEEHMRTKEAQENTKKRKAEKELEGKRHSEAIEQFQFADINEIRAALKQYAPQLHSFMKYIDKPETLPGYLLLVLKDYALKDQETIFTLSKKH